MMLLLDDWLTVKQSENGSQRLHKLCKLTESPLLLLSLLSSRDWFMRQISRPLLFLPPPPPPLPFLACTFARSGVRCVNAFRDPLARPSVRARAHVRAHKRSVIAPIESRINLYVHLLFTHPRATICDAKQQAECLLRQVAMDSSGSREGERIIDVCRLCEHPLVTRSRVRSHACTRRKSEFPHRRFLVPEARDEGGGNEGFAKGISGDVVSFVVSSDSCPFTRVAIANEYALPFPRYTLTSFATIGVADARGWFVKPHRVTIIGAGSSVMQYHATISDENYFWRIHARTYARAKQRRLMLPRYCGNYNYGARNCVRQRVTRIFNFPFAACATRNELKCASFVTIKSTMSYLKNYVILSFTSLRSALQKSRSFDRDRTLRSKLLHAEMHAYRDFWPQSSCGSSIRTFMDVTVGLDGQMDGKCKKNVFKGLQR
jgi:hypothetical protein